jgi:4-hydroxyphenylpyruvate dioxygenase
MREEERGGYLPVLDVLHAICDEKEGLGYKGWISMELFNRSLTVEGSEVPAEHANRAMESWRKIVQTMGWEDQVAVITLRQISKISKETEHVEGVGISARL